ncbi:Histamine H1 receptor [Trichinella pseudospiralis]
MLLSVFLLPLCFLGILLNTLLLAMLHQIHRPRKANLLFIAGLGVSNWLCAIGCLILQCHRIMIYFLKKEHQEWTVRDCLLKVPHMTLSTIGYDLFSLMILLLCLERVTAFYKLGLHYVIFDIDRTLLILISCFLIISVKITAAWVIAFMDMYKKVSAWCHMRECMNLIIYRSTAWTYMIIGYLTVVFYLATVALLLHRRSTTCTIMRQIQLNRERSIARSIAFVIICTFVCQILPWTLELVLTDKHMLHFVSLPLRTMNWSLTPTIYLVIHPDLRKQMKKLCHRIQACSQQSRHNLDHNSVYVGYSINLR